VFEIPHSFWKEGSSAGKYMVPVMDRISARQMKKTKRVSDFTMGEFSNDPESKTHFRPER
jgi:hypothetical protein